MGCSGFLGPFVSEKSSGLRRSRQCGGVSGQALCFAPSARAISRLTRDTDNPSSRAIALMLSALSVRALYSASYRFSQLASHWASVRDLRRWARGMSRSVLLRGSASACMRSTKRSSPR